MTRMRIVKVLTLAALVGASVSCGNLVRQGRSPVYLVIDSLEGATGSDPGNFSFECCCRTSSRTYDAGAVLDCEPVPDHL